MVLIVHFVCNGDINLGWYFVPTTAVLPTGLTTSTQQLSSMFAVKQVGTSASFSGFSTTQVGSAGYSGLLSANKVIVPLSLNRGHSESSPARIFSFGFSPLNTSPHLRFQSREWRSHHRSLSIRFLLLWHFSTHWPSLWKLFPFPVCQGASPVLWPPTAVVWWHSLYLWQIGICVPQNPLLERTGPLRHKKCG